MKNPGVTHFVFYLFIFYIKVTSEESKRHLMRGKHRESVFITDQSSQPTTSTSTMPERHLIKLQSSIHYAFDKPLLVYCPSQQMALGRDGAGSITKMAGKSEFCSSLLRRV